MLAYAIHDLISWFINVPCVLNAIPLWECWGILKYRVIGEKWILLLTLFYPNQSLASQSLYNPTSATLLSTLSSAFNLVAFCSYLAVLVLACECLGGGGGGAGPHLNCSRWCLEQKNSQWRPFGRLGYRWLRTREEPKPSLTDYLQILFLPPG